MLKEYLKRLADGFRDALGTSERISAQKFPEKISELYSAGKQAEYDAFWDKFQNNGARVNYTYGFAGWTWFTEIEPKHPLYNITAVDSMFYNCNYLQSLPTMTFAGAVSGYCMFNFCSRLTEVNQEIPIKGDCHAMFNYCPYLTKINKLVNNGVTRWTTSTFADCDRLQELIIEGDSINTAFYLNACKSLNKASIANTVNMLSGSTSGISCTFSKTAVNKAFETSEGANDGSTSDEWKSLVATKSNWTISLV